MYKLGFRIVPKDTSTCELLGLGIKPLTLRLVDDALLPDPQPPLASFSEFVLVAATVGEGESRAELTSKHHKILNTGHLKI